MQAQEVPPFAGQHGELPADQENQGHKKSVIGKVKDKAKKLKTKIKKPKSDGAEAGDNNDNDSSSEDESSGSDPQQQLSARPAEERDMVTPEGLQDASYEAVPDSHSNAIGQQPHVDASGVQNRFGQLRLGDEPEKMQEDVPSATGQVSAGVTPYLASHNLGEGPVTMDTSRAIPVEEGKDAEESDLLVKPANDKLAAPMDLDQPMDVSKTSENAAAWYTPTSEQDTTEGDQQKPLKDHVYEDATTAKDNVATTATSGAAALGSKSDPAGAENIGDQEKPLKDRVYEGAAAAKDNVAVNTAAGATALGLKSEPANTENVGGENMDVDRNQKSMLEQAKEKIWGSTKKVKDEPAEVDQDKTTITGKAANTVAGLKDTIASKLGYGSNKNLTGESDTRVIPSSDAAVDSTSVVSENPENKSVLQKIQETAVGATGAITSKLGYGDKQQSSSEKTVIDSKASPGEEYNDQAIEEMNPGDKKSYTQKATEAVYGVKDAVAAKLGYGGESQTDVNNKSYLQKMQETAASAKDAVASKLGYANTDLPSENAYDNQENVPASTAARFHPGDEDRALSQLITEKISTRAATVKDSLLKPFGSSKSGPPTPTTTTPPSSAAVAADPAHSVVSGQPPASPDVPHEEKSGFMGKVTGAVSSLLGSTPSGKKRVDEAVGKANEDSQAPGIPSS